jgi:hypothetical protein
MAAPASTKPYYLINCAAFREIEIRLSGNGKKKPALFSILGMSSKETVGAAFKAVDRSPFKTIFVVDDRTGHPIFAMTQNDEYVEFAWKRKNPGPTAPPLPPESACCVRCRAMGGFCTQDVGSDFCLCWGADNGNDVNQTLDSIPPPGI